jgi:glyoxylase-like metal-dependent hydrolase (beta-lactamase superfamily II)
MPRRSARPRQAGEPADPPSGDPIDAPSRDRDRDEPRDSFVVSGTHSHGARSHRHADAGLHTHDPESGEAVPAVPPPVAIAPGVLEIDTRLGGWERVTAGYLIEGSAPVLIETGSQSSVPVLLAALDQIGVGAAELAGVAVTHIHLDHAGGVGDVARAFPSATVYVHEKGARHLADPTRLIASAARVYGSLLDSLYGRLDPTPTDRLHVLEDGEEITVGPDRVLVAVDSPGHAKHHVALHDSSSGILFAGDAVGVKLPDGGVLRPATPPPDFDLDQALTSLQRFAARRPVGVALAHYGLLGEPDELLAEAEDTLRAWAGTAEAAWRAGEDIVAALSARFDTDLDGIAPEQREKLEVMNGIHSNAAGLRRWLDTTRTRPEKPR